MREGGLGAQFFGMWTFPYPRAGCAASIHRQLDALDLAVEKHPDDVSFCRSYDDVVAARTAGRVAALAGIEGGHALEGKIENVEMFARRGVRYLGLLHFSASDIGAPAKGVGRDDSRGLSPYGRDVIDELNRCGVIVDLAHVNRKGYFEALEQSTTPPIVSHTGVAGVKEHWRNIDDEQIKAVADRGGVIGVIFAPQYVGGDSVDAVCDHLMHIVKVAGPDAPALGSDYDGMIRPVRGLEDVAALPNLTAALLARGMHRDDVKKLLGGNAMRLLRAVPPANL
jgi:membrane dipeptidase